MLKIRLEQITILREAILRRFVERVSVELRRDFPDQLQDASDETLFSLVDRGIDQAAQVGVTDETDVRYYLSLLVEFGLDFGSTPETGWARTILEDEEIGGREKIEALDRAMLFGGGRGW